MVGPEEDGDVGKLLLKSTSPKAVLKQFSSMDSYTNSSQEPLVNKSQYNTLRKLTTNTAFGKPNREPMQIFVSALFAGGYIGFGGALYLKTVDTFNILIAAMLFPVGLSMVVGTGADLLTSNMFFAMLPFAMGEKRKSVSRKVRDLFRLLVPSLLGNCLGCIIIAYIMVQCRIIEPVTIAKVAYRKTNLVPTELFFRAILANWMVNVSIFQSNIVESFATKQILLWIPITTFVLLSLEHSVANAFFLSAGIFVGAEITAYQAIFGNFLLAFLGNFVGAIMFTFGQVYMLTTPAPSHLHKV